MDAWTSKKPPKWAQIGTHLDTISGHSGTYTFLTALWIESAKGGSKSLKSLKKDAEVAMEAPEGMSKNRCFHPVKLKLHFCFSGEPSGGSGGEYFSEKAP